MAVRTHVALHWRVLSVLVILAATLALASWIYDAGRRSAGFERSQTEHELDTLRVKKGELEKELGRLRSLADASESKLQIELTTRQQLVRQAGLLEEENVRLKEDLSVFESIALAEGREGSVSIKRLSVAPDASGTDNLYHYRMLVVMQGSRKETEFKGNLQLVVSIQLGGKSVMMLLPLPADANAPQYKVNFKHFRRLDGTFQIQPGARINSVEVRLLQSGVVKASKSVTL